VIELDTKVLVLDTHYDGARKFVGQTGFAIGRVPNGWTEEEDLILVEFDPTKLSFEQVFGDHYEDPRWNDCCFEGMEDEHQGIFLRSFPTKSEGIQPIGSPTD